MAYRPSVESDFYADFARARNPIEFRQKIGATVNNLAFSDFAFVRMNTSEAEGPSFATNPDKQLEIYQQEGFYEHDLMVRYAKENTQPLFMSQLYVAPTSIDKRVLDLNQAFSYHDYYCIPLAACNGHGNVMLGAIATGSEAGHFSTAGSGL